MIHFESKSLVEILFPTLMQTYSHVQGEESRRSVMVHIPSQDGPHWWLLLRMISKGRRVKGKIDLMMQKREIKLGTLEENVESYTVVLPKAVVVDVRVLRNLMLIWPRLQKVLLNPMLLNHLAFQTRRYMLLDAWWCSSSLLIPPQHQFFHTQIYLQVLLMFTLTMILNLGFLS